MLKTVARLTVKSRLKKKRNAGAKQFVAWDQINRVAIILSARDNINKSEIDHFVAGIKKYTEVFYIQLDSPKTTFHDWHCLTSKDKSLLSLPKKKLEQQLGAHEFDIVINTCQENELFSIPVASALKAPLKCGSTGRFNDVDLIIRKKGINTVTDYLKEVVKYLRMIRPQ